MYEITWGGKSEKQVLTYGHELCYTQLLAGGVKPMDLATKVDYL